MFKSKNVLITEHTRLKLKNKFLKKRQTQKGIIVKKVKSKIIL